MRSVPTILQQDAVECGAACLAMVLACHGRWVSLEELREVCGVGRDGIKASNIIKAARRYGLLAKGVSRDVGDLAALPKPFIVFWNFNHFVVVERLSAGGALINDPASGPRRVTIKELDAGFTGVVLVFEPSPGFLRSGRRTSLAGLLRARLRGNWSGLILAAIAGLSLVVPGVMISGFSKVFVDDVLIGGHTRWLVPVVTGLAIMALLTGLLTYLKQIALLRTQIATATVQSAVQMGTMLRLPLAFFDQRYPGDVANRFTLIDRLAGIVSSSLAPAAISLVSVIAYGMVLFLIDPVLAAIVDTAALIALAATQWAARSMADAGRRQIASESKLQAITVQGLSMLEDFKATGVGDAFLSRWSGAQARVLSAEQASALRSLLLNHGAQGVIALAGVAVLVVGAFRVMDGAITIGALLAFQILTGFFTAPVLGLVGIGSQVQQARGLAERLDDIARYRGSISARTETPVIPASAGQAVDIALRNVTYGFAPFAAPLIADLSFSAPSGARIALVGPSGSGKSTLGRLVVRLVEPWSGEIALGGIELSRWDVPTLRRAMAYVDQSSGLFEGSIHDNICLWDTTVPEAQVIAAAHDAGAHDFITRRPGGYRSRVAEGANNLSGGERQRLAIARALVHNPSMLVLDEATSALDTVTELHIMNAVRRRGCTTLVIAHRLSTVRDCDCILVLHDGRIVEAGSHAVLMQAGGIYRRLVEA